MEDEENRCGGAATGGFGINGIDVDGLGSDCACTGGPVRVGRGFDELESIGIEGFCLFRRGSSLRLGP